MGLTEGETNLIASSIKRCERDLDLLGTPIVAKKPHEALHGVLIWHPIRQYNVDFLCPIHGLKLKSEDDFVDGKKKSELPRRIFDLPQNVLLVSCKYICSTCASPYRAHDERITRQLPSSIQLPFILFNQSGFTISSFNHIAICSRLGNISIILYLIVYELLQ